jgi:hypothetical protein
MHVADIIIEFETMSNIDIFMEIINIFLPNLPITSVGRGYNNDHDTSSLTSGSYIELVG